VPGRGPGKDFAVQVHISPDARQAAAWDLKQLASFNVENGKLLSVIPGEYKLDDRHYFLPGNRLALGFRNRTHGGIGVYDLARGEEVAQYVHGEKPHNVACANRAGLILTAARSTTIKDSTTLAVWKPGDEPDFYDIPNTIGVKSLVVAPDGSRAFTADVNGVLQLWDVAQGVVLRRFDLAVLLESMMFDGTTLIVDEQYNEKRHIFELVK
jgi:hypothetical protein